MGKRLVLDPAPPWRYLNHSCEPTCALILHHSKKQDAMPTLLAQAITDIPAGHEVCNDYGWAAEHAIVCRCGMPKCRGWVVAKRQLRRIEGNYSLTKTRPTRFTSKKSFDSRPIRKAFPHEFSFAANKRAANTLELFQINPKLSLHASRRSFVSFSELIPRQEASRMLLALDRHILPELKPSRVPIPRSSITEMKENYCEQLEKTVDFLTTDLNRPRSRVYRIARQLGVVQLMRSRSLLELGEAISGYRLDPEMDCQVSCYHHGSYVGPHNDHFPEHQRARTGYVDLHITLCNRAVDQQWLIYEDKGLLSQVVDVATTGALSVCRLPFWHYTTPLVAKPGREFAARRWLLVVSYDILGKLN